MASGIHVSDKDAIRILTVSNPSKRNAFTGRMTASLLAELDRADADPAVRAIVVTGADGYFSSGHDLQEVLAEPASAGDPVANAAFSRPSEILTPVIGAIDGPAYAAGFILALNCDLRVATPGARFCGVGAAIGLVPVGGQLSRLLDLVGYPIAYRWLATAAPFTAQEAERHGFVTTLHDGEHALDGALELAEQIAKVSPAVVAALKGGLSHTLHHGSDAGRAVESQLAALVRALPDGDEGVRSFLERRPAVYPDRPTNLPLQIEKVLA
ncbi:enoyl-CoA hydratase/isomerase family protein [Streptomyces reniochalinae]|uniref:Enoyl-CoA hydratase/isomerase family protein n=1 Tax=Streptomyces reniochalinae TaxID=2250578 RepID=A0A367E8U6_9ACTN|nr:enoyl-CoA hydratase/isomerase family protein [Streptomyces reniochalinae]RCG13670.1 enoyl-CoA hydratase/isomerase family protein [Streptomyces reniochalinae]